MLYSRFLRGLQQNRAQSRLLYLLISFVFVYSTDQWEKQNTSPVCFGAKDGQFGRFYVKSGYKKLAAVRLVHLYGYVSCDTRQVSYWSYWGCGLYREGLGKINVVITNSDNQVLLPPSEFIVNDGAKWSKIPGFHRVSAVVFQPLPRRLPPRVTSVVWRGSNECWRGRQWRHRLRWCICNFRLSFHWAANSRNKTFHGFLSDGIIN